MAVAWHGVGVADVHPGDSVLVLGGGPIGIGVHFALRARGIQTIIVSEPVAERRTALERLGIDHIVNPLVQNLQDEVLRLTGAPGVTATIDAAGAPQAFVEGIQCLAVGGRMVTLALYREPTPLTRPLLAAGRSIRSSAVYSTTDFREVIGAMRDGRITLDGEWVRFVDFADVASAIEDLHLGATLRVLVRTPASDGIPLRQRSNPYTNRVLSARLWSSSKVLNLRPL